MDPVAVDRVGIVGAGELGLAFAGALARAGICAVISDGGGGKCRSALAHDLDEKVRTTTLDEAAEQEVVLLSVPWILVADTLAMVPDWEGRILIDATDPILPDLRLAELGGRTSSEIVKELAPGAQLVKAFNTLPPDVLAANPEEAGGRRVIFFSGDHVRAKAEVARLIEFLGFAGIDIGGLADGGRLQQFPHGPLRGLNLISMATG